jgi:tRNA pseudouridine55 synthase
MNGVLNIYKPPGMTSFDVVRIVKKVCNTKKVGHAGTLDPAAEGVLPVCIGKCTKIIDYIMNEHKVYDVEMTLGIVTDTYDREGKIISDKPVTVSSSEVEQVILSFIGESMQMPPMYSALKVDGKRLYELARNGIEIEREKRRINLFDIKILMIELPKVNFEVTCSKGTYIRSLCFDIGERLQCGAMMSGLTRVATGKFHMDQAVNINDLDCANIGENIIKIEDVLSHLTKINVDDKFNKLLTNGVIVKDKGFLKRLPEEKLMVVYSVDDKLIGIGAREMDSFRMEKLLI